MNNFKTKLLFLLIATGLIHGIYNFFIPLHPDEAYYWLWSRHIDWSYYDHPAMIAWMIRLLSFFGDSEGAVRLATVLCMTGTGYALSMTAYHIKGEKAGLLTFAAFAVLPATAMGYAFVTPDSPLMLFWAFATYYTCLAVTTEKPVYFILTGISIALMITSKYTAILFPFALFFYILVFNRKLFRNKYTWIACLIGILGVVPTLIWNIQHDFISIRFQYAHGTSSTFKILWEEFFILVLGLQILPTPLFAFIMYKVGFFDKSYRKEQWFRLLFTLFFVPLVFFLYKGLFKKMEINWPIIAFISMLPVIGVYVADGFSKKIFKWGALFALFITVVLMSSPFVPLPEKANIAVRRLLGHKDAVIRLETYVKEGDSLFSNHLTTASMMVYYMKNHPRVYIPVESRFSQFTIWDKDVNYDGMHGWYLGNRNSVKELTDVFGSAEHVEEYATGSKEKPKYYNIIKVGGE